MADEVTQTPEAVQTPQGPQLTLADLTLALQTIQVVAQRGAIKAEEMATVGGLHDRLLAFLQAQGAVQAPEAPPSETAPAATSVADAPQGE